MKAFIRSVLSILVLWSPAGKTACLQGEMTLPLPPSDTGRFIKAKLSFRLELPTAERLGQLTSTLLNGEDEYRLTVDHSGKQMSRVADAVSTDDTTISGKMLASSEPGLLLSSADDNIQINLKPDQSEGGASLRFEKYFRVYNPKTAIRIQKVRACEN